MAEQLGTGSLCQEGLFLSGQYNLSKGVYLEVLPPLLFSDYPNPLPFGKLLLLAHFFQNLFLEVQLYVNICSKCFFLIQKRTHYIYLEHIRYTFFQ